MKLILILFTLITNTAFGSDDIMIQIYKKDGSGRTIETNHLQINESSIYYSYDGDKGEARTLLPGELEYIVNAMKSQVSYVTFNNQPKPSHIPYYKFSLEYDVGAKSIKFDVKAVSLVNELSVEMKSLIQKYFKFQFK